MATETQAASVCLSEHSYICRLDEYMQKHHQTKNLGYKPMDVIINSIGIGEQLCCLVACTEKKIRQLVD